METRNAAEWSGPSAGSGHLTHDLGVWLNHQEGQHGPAAARKYRLAVATRAPLPMITGLDVWPDPRVQLGDVITVRSPVYLGAVFTALVTGVTNRHDGAASQSLSIRLLSVTVTGSQSYEDWSTQHPGTLTYAQWAALTTQTYTAFAGSED